MGRQKYPLWIIVTAIVGAILLFIGFLFTFWGNMALMDHNIVKVGSLANDSTYFKTWSTGSKLLLKIYFFNVSNPAEVTRGETPIVQEIGPYVYEIRKVDITFPEYDEVEYRQQFSSYFNPELSQPLRESDTMTIIDVALMGSILTASEFLSDQMARVKMGVDKMFPGRESVFISSSVGALLFGGVEMNCSDRAFMIPLVCRQLAKQAPGFFWKDNTRTYRFAFMHDRNLTNPSVYKAYQGLRDISQRGVVKTFKNNPTISVWGSDYCNMINGSSAGDIHPPHLKPTSRLYYFEEFLGRSVYADFIRPTTRYDLDLFLFETTESFYGSPDKYPDNACYCPRGLPEKENDTAPLLCPPDGLLNMASYIRAPVLASHPRFAYADPKLFQDLKLNNTEKIEDFITFTEIEPMLGIPIAARTSVQLNMEIRQIATFPYLEKIQPRIMPGLWLENVFTTDEGSLQHLQGAIGRIRKMRVLSGCIIGLGALFLLVAAAAFFYNHDAMRRKQSKVTSNEICLEPVSLYSQEKNNKSNISSTSTLSMTPNTVCYQQNYM